MNSIVFQIHKKNRIATFKFTLIGVSFFCKKIRIKLLFSEKIRHIKYNRWNTGACLCNIGRNKDGLRPEASTSARASGGQFTGFGLLSKQGMQEIMNEAEDEPEVSAYVLQMMQKKQNGTDRFKLQFMPVTSRQRRAARMPAGKINPAGILHIACGKKKKKGTYEWKNYYLLQNQ